MWDRRRQIVWLAAGLIVGTFVAFSDAHDEDDPFVLTWLVNNTFQVPSFISTIKRTSSYLRFIAPDAVLSDWI